MGKNKQVGEINYSAKLILFLQTFTEVNICNVLGFRPEKSTSEKEIANACIRIQMPKVQSKFFLSHNYFRV